MEMVLTLMDLVPFRGATAAAVDRSTTLATTVTGGRRMSARVPTRGTGTYTMTTARCTGATTPRRTALVSDASRTDSRLLA